MPVIAIVNRKGGCGKSTLATHLAAHCAKAGMSVMLGDVDQQQSTKTWLRLRSAQLPNPQQDILGWVVEPGRGLRPPIGITHVILDTPGGLSGFELARVALFADAILMPVCSSVFDRESAAACHAELMALPRVASGRCKVAAVGMRVDSRTRSAKVLRDWAETLKLPFIGVLRDSQAYVRCIENGLSLFDLPEDKAKADLLQWSPILRWIAPVLHPQAPAVVSAQPVLSPAKRLTEPTSHAEFNSTPPVLHFLRATSEARSAAGSRSAPVASPTPPHNPPAWLASLLLSKLKFDPMLKLWPRSG